MEGTNESSSNAPHSNLIGLQPWEFRAFRLQPFIIVAALSALLALAVRHFNVAHAQATILAGIMILVPITMLPAITASTRHYRHVQVSVRRPLPWYLVVTLITALAVWSWR